MSNSIRYHMRAVPYSRVRREPRFALGQIAMGAATRRGDWCHSQGPPFARLLSKTAQPHLATRERSMRDRFWIPVMFLSTESPRTVH